TPAPASKICNLQFAICNSQSPFCPFQFPFCILQSPPHPSSYSYSYSYSYSPPPPPPRLRPLLLTLRPQSAKSAKSVDQASPLTRHPTPDTRYPRSVRTTP